MALPDISNEQVAADFLRVTVELLARWREEGAGPDFTSLRGGGARYDTRDLKIYLRQQAELRKSGQEE